MGDFSDKFMSGQALTPGERQEFIGDPTDTLTALLNQAQRGSLANSSQALDALAGLAQPPWEEGIRGRATDALIDSLSGQHDFTAMSKLRQLDPAIWWDRLMERVLKQDIRAQLDRVVPILYDVRKDDTRDQLSGLAEDQNATAAQRKWALDALSYLAREPKPNDAAARRTLSRVAVQGASAEVQRFAITTLTNIGAGEFLDDLGELIREDRDPLLLQALLDYVLITPNPGDALLYLRRLSNARDPEIRERLVGVLKVIRTPDIVPILRDILRFEREDKIIREVVNALRDLNDVSEKVEPLVTVAKNSQADPGLRRLAITTLGGIDNEQAAQALFDVLDSLQNETLESSVLEILAQMGKQKAIARRALLQAVTHSDARIRQQARTKLVEAIAGEEGKTWQDEVFDFVSQNKRLGDGAAKSLAALLRSLAAERVQQDEVAQKLTKQALDADNLGAVFVLRDLIGAERLADLFAETLDPKSDPRPAPEQIGRAENALIAVPSQRGIEVLVRHRIDRSRRSREERLGLVSTGDDDQDGTGETIFQELRKSAVTMFTDTAGNRAKGAYTIMLIMNTASFLLTFAFTIICLYYAFVANPDNTGESLELLAGGGALLGGLLTVIQARLFVPVKAVQDSVANLAMVQMTFMGFISRLEQVRVVFQDHYVDSAFDVAMLRETDEVLKALVADAMAQMTQFLYDAEQPARGRDNN